MFSLSLLPIAFLALIPIDALAAPVCGLIPTSTASAIGSTSGTGDTTGNGTSSQLISAAWYPDWLGLTSTDVSWSKYTMVTYAFGLTTDDTSVIELTNPSDLEVFVSAAHENNVTALLSVGGWSGSRFFSTAVGSAENRTTFVQTIVDLVNTYDLDGIDFDWEYPGTQGIGCNVVSTDDATNYLSFLQELREDAIGQDMYISAAVSITPFIGPDGVPLVDVSEFSDVLDHIAIMNYDISGSWSATVGPNAPLSDTCALTQTGSAVSALAAWTEAGIPAEQIVLGVAGYGHSFTVPETSFNALSSDAGGELSGFPAFTGIPHGDSDDAASFTDVCGTTTGFSGVYNFWGLIEDGFLNSNGTAEDGIEYIFDECSQTPYIYNRASQIMVSYDDATSFQAKGKFIVENELRGFAMWQIAGDSNDILLDAINGAMAA